LGVLTSKWQGAYACYTIISRPWRQVPDTGSRLARDNEERFSLGAIALCSDFRSATNRPQFVESSLPEIVCAREYGYEDTDYWERYVLA